MTIKLFLPLFFLNIGLFGSRTHAFFAVRHFSRRLPTTIVCKRDTSVSKVSAKVSETDPGRVVGTSLKLLKYPHPKLRVKNVSVDKFDDELANTTKEMLLVMYAANGVGLAAPQVGINKRIVVFNQKTGTKSKKTLEENEKVLINPVITAKAADTRIGEEGCLSFPNIEGDVERHTWVEVSYQDLQGVNKVHRFENRLAVIFQHEYDHLDGMLLVDRLVPKSKEKVEHTLEKLVRKYGPGGAL